MPKKFSPPKRPRDPKRYRRDINRFVFWKDKSGQWYGQSTEIKGARPFKWKEPRGKYKNKQGQWRTISKKSGKSVKTAEPALFKPRVQTTRKRRTTHDAKGLNAFREILNQDTPSLWDYVKSAPIRPRLGRKGSATRGVVNQRPTRQVKGSLQGFRTVAMFTSSRPYLTTFFDLQQVMRAAGDDPVMIKAFDRRRTVIHVEFKGESDIWHWTSPALARDFNTTVTQAEDFIQQWANKYVIQSDDDDSTPDSQIRRIQLLIE